MICNSYADKTMKSTLLFLAAITVLCTVALRDLVRTGYFESHDGVIHVMRLTHFDEALKSGQFPVRWLSTWSGGYGSPVFNFIWPLPYYVAALIHWTGFSYAASIKLILLASFVLSGFTFYLFFYEISRNRFAAFAGSMLYLWAPYRFTDIFIRGAVGEATSFLFLPLVLWIVHVGSRSEKRSVSPFWGVVIALFIFTHNIMAVLGIGFMVLYAVWLTVKNKLSYQFLRSVIWVVGIGCGIAATYWLPAVVEQSYTRLSSYLSGSYGMHFVPLPALFNSAWKYAYAAPWSQEHSMSFQVGLVHWLLFFLSLIFLPLVYKYHKQMRPVVNHGIFFLITAVVLILMITTPTGEWLYRFIPQLSFLNYPWRLLEIMTFALSVVGATLVAIIGKGQKLAGIALVITLIYINLPISRIVSQSLTYSDQEYYQLIRTNTGFLPDSEFLPPGYEFHTLLKERGDKKNKDLVEFVDNNNNGNLHTDTLSPLHFKTSVITSEPQLVRINQFFFPGWQVKVNANLVEITKDEFGLMQIALPAGSNTVEVAFQNTWERTVANVVSGGSVVILLLIGLNKLIGLRKETKS